ncbi:MAG: nucleotidyltransferase domain-containing protein [bacterium]
MGAKFLQRDTRSVPWAVTSQKIQAVIEKIIETSRPRKIILFGSYVRGNMHLNSDLDVMIVVGNEVKNPRKESIRIRRRLKGILMWQAFQAWSTEKHSEMGRL